MVNDKGSMGSRRGKAMPIRKVRNDRAEDDAIATHNARVEEREERAADERQRAPGLALMNATGDAVKAAAAYSTAERIPEVEDLSLVLEHLHNITKEIVLGLHSKRQRVVIHTSPPAPPKARLQMDPDAALDRARSRLKALRAAILPWSRPSRDDRFNQDGLRRPITKTDVVSIMLLAGEKVKTNHDALACAAGFAKVITSNAEILGVERAVISAARIRDRISDDCAEDIESALRSALRACGMIDKQVQKLLPKKKRQPQK